MAADLGVASAIASLSAEAAEVLSSPERPILLVPRVAAAPVAPSVAPGLEELGVLLPYTPMHHLLFAHQADGSPGAPPVLVMTSGNLSGEPLCHTDLDAVTRLSGIADAFLGHDREIAVPCEDSVLAWHRESSGPGQAVPLRRSRGFAPSRWRCPAPRASPGRSSRPGPS